MSAEIYIFRPGAEDFSTVGECGKLIPSRYEWDGSVNAVPEITLEHPIDRQERYLLIQEGWIIQAPAPVRTTPEIRNGQFVTSVEIWTIRSGATKAQRYIYKKKSGNAKKKLLSAGTEVVVTQAPEDGRWKVKSGKYTGWMDPDGLTGRTETEIPDDVTGIEEVAPSWEARPQLFEIYAVNKTDRKITAHARAIAGSAMYDLTTYDTDDTVTLQEAADGILENLLGGSAITVNTNITGTRTGVHARDMNPVEALFDPESGLAARWNAEAVFDDDDIYLLDAAGRDRGVTIEYAKNLAGIDMDVNIDDVATHIRPIGEKKNGDPLYLEENNGLVVCPNAENYPYMRIYPLEVSDAKVNKGVTEALARTRMREAADELIAQNIDVPKVSVKADFVNLGDTPRYAQYKGLMKVFLYDRVTIYHPILRINMTAAVCRIKWDGLRNRIIDTELGEPEEMTPKTPSWQISGKISGEKLLSGTVGAAQMGDDIIGARHIQAGGVNTDALQAGAVTANKIAAEEIVSSDANIDRLKSAFAEIVGAYIEDLQAGDIEADRMGAALARFQTVVAGTAEFDAATIKHLVSNFFNLDGSGSFEDVYIYNLVVTTAQITAAIVQDLALKGDDGHYYKISVSDGELSPVMIPDNQIDEQAGQTTDGTRALIDSELSQLDMTSGPTIKGLVGVINRIYASIVDTDTLLARKSFVDALYTNQIFSNNSESIQIISQRAQQALNDIQAAVKITPDGIVVADMNKGTDTTKALIATDSFSVVDKNGQTAASLGLRRQTLGTLTVWETEDGGHAFV